MTLSNVAPTAATNKALYLNPIIIVFIDLMKDCFDETRNLDQG